MAATCALEYNWVKGSRKVDGKYHSGSQSEGAQKFGKLSKQNYFILYPSFHDLHTRRIFFFSLLLVFLELPNFHPCQSVRKLTSLYPTHPHIPTQTWAHTHIYPHRHSTCSQCTPKDIENTTHSEPTIGSRLRNNMLSYRTGL